MATDSLGNACPGWKRNGANARDAAIESWTHAHLAPRGWRPLERTIKEFLKLLLSAWLRAQCATVASTCADMAHLASEVDRWATSRLMESGELAPDASAALRAVMSGGAVCEAVAAKWNGKTPTCPHCGPAHETLFHRFWQCPAWDENRRRALSSATATGVPLSIQQLMAFLD